MTNDIIYKYMIIGIFALKNYAIISKKKKFNLSLITKKYSQKLHIF